MEYCGCFVIFKAGHFDVILDSGNLTHAQLKKTNEQTRFFEFCTL